MLVPLGRAKGFPFRVLQSMVLFGLSSAGFPTGGSGLRQTLSPVPKRTSFPLPSTGRPYSHREAPLLLMQLFENNTHYSRSQPDRPNFSRSQLRLPDNNNPATKTQAKMPVETPTFLWERALRAVLEWEAGTITNLASIGISLSRSFFPPGVGTAHIDNGALDARGHPLVRPDRASELPQRAHHIRRVGHPSACPKCRLAPPSLRGLGFRMSEALSSGPCVAVYRRRTAYAISTPQVHDVVLAPAQALRVRVTVHRFLILLRFISGYKQMDFCILHALCARVKISACKHRELPLPPDFTLRPTSLR